MRSRLGLFLVILLSQITVNAQTGPVSVPPDAKALSEQVGLILTGKCLACHGSDTRKGKLDLTRRATLLAGGESGPGIESGKPEESLLIEKLSAGEMPPKNPLTAEQVAVFRAWVNAGAPYGQEPLTPRRAGPDWWSLRPIGRPVPPNVAGSSWARSPVDAFVLAKLKEQGLAPAPEADRATLIRRTYFDVIGLPPTPEEVETFVNNPSPLAYEALVERLLASPRYGERWGRHWLDVVRFGESEGYEMNHVRPNAWPFRDYVIRAFNRDTPLPRFVLEQLAGDTLNGSDWLTQAATGFLVGGTHDEVGNATVEGKLQQRMDDLDDMIAATGSAFLGLTVNCARCHDHKFDPITQKDYYGLQAVLAGVQHSERDVKAEDTPERRQEAADARVELARIDREIDDLEPMARPDAGMPGRARANSRRNVDRFVPVEARFVRFTVLATIDPNEPCLDELEVWSAEASPRNVALASYGSKASASSEYPNAAIHKIDHLNDGRYGNGRSWISRVARKGWAQIELPRVETIDRIVWGRDRDGVYQDRVPSEYYIEVAKTPGDWHVVASSGDRGLEPAATSGEAAALLQRQDALRVRLAALGSTRKVYAGTFTEPGSTRLLRRGDPMQPGDEVVPSAIRSVGPPLVVPASAKDSDRRAALARWIGDPSNPLPARVMVNRVWHYHFGRGLVATPSDFGFNGGRPSHPELLDWLAGQYVDGGFTLKPIHRLILLSSAYRQSSRIDNRALRTDRDNVYLWRSSPRRLEAEPLRDAILTVSGTMNGRMGGPGYDLWESNTNYVHVYKPKANLGPDEFRRMVYQFRPRSQQDPTLGAFDCPDSALVMPRRTVSTTALQALNLLNGSFVIDQAEAFAERLEREVGKDLGRQVDRGFLLAFGRRPTAEERAAAVVLARMHGTAALCRGLYNANEFLYVQ
ncbi:MAG: PSD1 and planctomycete cytochrome C domain-containing protein [Isosphaeraceae bacterium]|nr:PSD1 and planctomycete cytochrome C domain-containing protein [Isosphaeraceae bacterium]